MTQRRQVLVQRPNDRSDQWKVRVRWRSGNTGAKRFVCSSREIFGSMCLSQIGGHLPYVTHSIQCQNSTPVNPDNQPGMESKTLSKQLEESIAECAHLKMENDKLRRDLNAAVMYSIQNQRRPIQKPYQPNLGIAKSYGSLP